MPSRLALAWFDTSVCEISEWRLRIIKSTSCILCAGGAFVRLPIYNLFEPVGQIEITQDGLFYEYQAEVCPQADMFTRLYGHNVTGSSLLGLCVPQEQFLFCRGRISKRNLDFVDGITRFSIVNQPWTRLRTEPFCSQVDTVLVNTENHITTLLFKRFERLPTQLMRYFCFFQPCTIAKESCLMLSLDENGNPFIAGET